MRKYPKIKTAIFDIESNGLLQESDYYKWDPRHGQVRPPMSRIHCLIIRDYERRINYIFRHNAEENSIDEGLAMLEESEILVGHNIISFDLPALDLIFSDVNFQGSVFDTLPMVRMMFANQKDLDFRLFEQGKIPGALIGSHTLEAWGLRLGVLKGDYVKECQELGIDPWGEWSQNMEDYCVQDVACSVALYEKCVAMGWDLNAIKMEHMIHDLMGQQERNGIPFNVEEATKLELALRFESNKLHEEVVSHFGKWWAPEKKRVVRMQWDDPDGVNKSKKYKPHYPDLGEDLDRAVWAEITFRKREARKTVTYLDGTTVKEHYHPDWPYCKIEQKEFNPGSRPQIIDRLTTIYNWHPVDFTENGTPEVNDSALRKMVHIPMAEKLAELFYYQKRLGQLADGKNGLLKLVDSKGFIHGYVNTGGTISGRASHVAPNLAQVPKVKFVLVLDANGNVVLNDKGKPKMRIGIGREGDHGFDFRNLFYVPEPWMMVGADLEGIELRCFGEQLAKYDNGAYIELVLTGDIHTHNQHAARLETRDQAKTFIYACVPMDTQALTKDGWKTYDQLQVGELVLTYNATTKVKEWKPVLEKVFYEDAEVIEMKTDQTFSVRCTPNHRWFTWLRQRVNGYRLPPVYEVVEAKDLKTEHNIIVNAPMHGDSFSYGEIDCHNSPKWETPWSQKVLDMNTSETKRSHVTCQRMQYITHPNQPVWCIRTENESWVMRQGNTITITGNTIYGAGDVKIGSIVAPLASEDEQRAIGKKLRDRFLVNLPAFAKVTHDIQQQARRGLLPGLDGRRLYVRSKHSALNTKLQSDAALIAKRWVLLTESMLTEPYLYLDFYKEAELEPIQFTHGWNGDFAQLLWIHDEIQTATLHDFEHVGKVAEFAAKKAGQLMGYSCPISAKAKVGHTWAQTH